MSLSSPHTSSHSLGSQVPPPLSPYAMEPNDALSLSLTPRPPPAASSSGSRRFSDAAAAARDALSSAESGPPQRGGGGRPRTNPAPCVPVHRHTERLVKTSWGTRPLLHGTQCIRVASRGGRRDARPSTSHRSAIEEIDGAAAAPPPVLQAPPQAVLPAKLEPAPAQWRFVKELDAPARVPCVDSAAAAAPLAATAHRAFAAADGAAATAPAAAAVAAAFPLPGSASQTQAVHYSRHIRLSSKGQPTLNNSVTNPLPRVVAVVAPRGSRGGGGAHAAGDAATRSALASAPPSAAAACLVSAGFAPLPSSSGGSSVAAAQGPPTRGSCSSRQFSTPSSLQEESNTPRAYERGPPHTPALFGGEDAAAAAAPGVGFDAYTEDVDSLVPCPRARRGGVKQHVPSPFSVEPMFPGIPGSAGSSRSSGSRAGSGRRRRSTGAAAAGRAAHSPDDAWFQTAFASLMVEPDGSGGGLGAAASDAVSQVGVWEKGACEGAPSWAPCGPQEASLLERAYLRGCRDFEVVDGEAAHSVVMASKTDGVRTDLSDGSTARLRRTTQPLTAANAVLAADAATLSAAVAACHNSHAATLRPPWDPGAAAAAAAAPPAEAAAAGAAATSLLPPPPPTPPHEHGGGGGGVLRAQASSGTRGHTTFACRRAAAVAALAVLSNAAAATAAAAALAEWGVGASSSSSAAAAAAGARGRKVVTFAPRKAAEDAESRQSAATPAPEVADIAAKINDVHADLQEYWQTKTGDPESTIDDIDPYELVLNMKSEHPKRHPLSSLRLASSCPEELKNLAATVVGPCGFTYTVSVVHGDRPQHAAKRTARTEARAGLRGKQSCGRGNGGRGGGGRGDAAAAAAAGSARARRGRYGRWYVPPSRWGVKETVVHGGFAPIQSIADVCLVPPPPPQLPSTPPIPPHFLCPPSPFPPTPSSPFLYFPTGSARAHGDARGAAPRRLRGGCGRGQPHRHDDDGEQGGPGRQVRTPPLSHRQTEGSREAPGATLRRATAQEAVCLAVKAAPFCTPTLLLFKPNQIHTLSPLCFRGGGGEG